jgi:Tfp pilus assembly protein PilN
MMIKINLLSDKDREERKNETKLGIILRAGLSVILALLILLGLFVSFEMILNIELQSTRKETNVHPSDSQKDIALAEEMLKNAKNIAGKINSTSQEIPYWSKVFEKLSNDVPDGIKISSVHIEKLHLKITGFAKTRDAFLAFQDKLKRDEYGNLVSPISNLVAPENFNFTVETDLQKKYLNQP